MADTWNRLHDDTLSATADTVVYTVPALTKVTVTEIIVANKTAGAIVATVQLGNTKIVPGKSIPANDALVIKTNTLMLAAETIKAWAGAVTSIDCRISGLEMA